jgi:hypothetical protein
MNMPVPHMISGGKAFDNFANISVENAVNYLLGLGIPFEDNENKQSK